MPEQHQPEHRNDFVPLDLSQSKESQLYSIRRKGSRYNILGSRGRVFPHYQSASIAGPRWEELTGAPWPYRSEAYESGMRLWQLGLIPREQVGQQRLMPPASAATPQPNRADACPPVKTNKTKKSVPKQDKLKQQPTVKPHVEIPRVVYPLALPAPRINLREQAHVVDELRRNPHLLFDSHIRVVLQNEVDYHLPQARWARKLLSLLDHYENRQRRQSRLPHLSEETILARHIAWQEEQHAVTAAV